MFSMVTIDCVSDLIPNKELMRFAGWDDSVVRFDETWEDSSDVNSRFEALDTGDDRRKKH